MFTAFGHHFAIIACAKVLARMFFKRTPAGPCFAKIIKVQLLTTIRGQRRNIIGDRVRRARNGFDPPMTQDQLAGRLARGGVQLDRVAIAKIEGGIRCAFDFEVKALAAVLKVDARWLMGIPSGVEKATSRKRRV